MEGAPEIAFRLAQLGSMFSSQHRFVKAACAYSSASRASRSSPGMQAYCLYHASLNLFQHATVAQSANTSELLTRALQQLRKCNILLRNQPASFEIRMQVTALLERIYTANRDSLAAAKIINSGLEAIARSQEDRTSLMKWWIYFRGRAVGNALTTGNSTQHAAGIASETAQQCVNSGDHISAAGFFLAQCQVSLANTSPRTHLIPDFERALSCLTTASPASPIQRSEVIMLTVCHHVLEALSCFRVGNLAEVGSSIIGRLQAAYAKLRALKNTTNVRREINANWKWVNLEVIAALAFHILGVVRRGSSAGGKRPKSHPTRMALLALGKLGIPPRMLPNLKVSDLNVRGVSRTAIHALCVALLEGAARSYLAEGDLREASMFVSAAAKIVFIDSRSRKLISQVEHGEDVDLAPVVQITMPHGELLQRSALLLLVSEYHSLRATISGARVATRFLQAIKTLPARMRPVCGEVWVTDTWQQAISHLSLLVGMERMKHPLEDERFQPSTVNSEEDVVRTDFTNAQVLAMALFTVGVYNLRKPAIIEAQRALNASIDILKDVKALNQQAMANVLAVYSSIGMLHLSITSKDSNMTIEAVNLAKTINDPITMVRACRQRRKLIHRLGIVDTEKAEAEQLLRDAMVISEGKRKLAVPHILC
ncbi:hypothetical protein BWQ96_06780 [Gracilariopsis chorda]|uniref:Uncharacterized protein n=1 Tax=Gracilariopsis chorda TaxID=448386 RepID=A0A2V3IN50_9FLOR|nr:hypothetical protein BWQ96_06780 [Gracilariopsis chorda]|eukprot:PXF43487.1 hypothetical protein BWQ96_06780 [Gracilariopsis chorda]